MKLPQLITFLYYKFSEMLCFNMQMRPYMVTYLHIFPEQKSEHWMKPCLTFLFQYVVILKTNHI